jgi:uncharacterized protein
MRRIPLMFLLCLLSCSFGFAQQNPADQPATKEDVEKYLQAMHSHEMMQKMLKSMMGPMHQIVHEQYVRNQDKLPADFEAHMNAYMDDMMTQLPWGEMMDAMIPAYQKHFTKGDLQALTAFYSSPTGQKILAELPAVTAESMQTMMPIMQKHMDGMQKRFEQEMAALVQESQKAQPNKAPVSKN